MVSSNNVKFYLYVTNLYSQHQIRNTVHQHHQSKKKLLTSDKTYEKLIASDKDKISVLAQLFKTKFRFQRQNFNSSTIFSSTSSPALVERILKTISPSQRLFWCLFKLNLRVKVAPHLSQNQLILQAPNTRSSTVQMKKFLPLLHIHETPLLRPMILFIFDHRKPHHVMYLLDDNVSNWQWLCLSLLCLETTTEKVRPLHKNSFGSREKEVPFA